MVQTQHHVAAKTPDPYRESFERFEQAVAQSPSWLWPRRRAGISRYTEAGFPSVQEEDWRFTNVTPLTRLPFKTTSEYSRGGLTPESIQTFPFTRLKSNRLVFVNGHYADELSSVLPQKENVRITSLATALNLDSDLLERHLTAIVLPEDNVFAALNTAFFQDGAFIFVPAGCAVEEPVHLLYISTASEAGTRTHPRNLIIAEKGSRLTVLESYVSTLDTPYFTNSVTELAAGDGAVVEHCKFQDESAQAYHISTLHAQLSRNTRFLHHSMSTGARLARNNIKTTLAGEGIDCILNGLYLAKVDQLVDHHMVVEHAKAHCNSHEYFNGILDARSRGVFHGRILVRPEAQKTDAKQTNKNLLLSDDATIDTKPQLEIYADDVKCTHGATIGQLNDESVFYLRARGIGLDTARRMLIHAFAGEIIDRIKFQPARQELDELFWNRLEQNPQIAGHR